MKTSNFTWGDEIIDSRDIICRYEELQYNYDFLKETLEEAEEDLAEYNLKNPDGEDPAEVDSLVDAIKEAHDELIEFEKSDDKAELDILKEVVEECETCSDWDYGEALIHENHFMEYIEDLVNDCYEFPEEFGSGKWPWNHMNMDWESAAEDAKQDYHEFTVDGETYYIRA